MPDIRDPIGKEEVHKGHLKDSNEDLDEYAPKRREMDFREAKWFYRVRVGFLLTVSFACVGVAISYLWHLVAPDDWRWLSEKNVGAIKDLALSIIVGLSMTLLTTYFFKRK